MVTQLTNVVELSQAKRLAIGFGFSEGPPWHPEGYGLFVDVRANRTIRMVTVQVVDVMRRWGGLLRPQSDKGEVMVRAYQWTLPGTRRSYRQGHCGVAA